MNTDRLYEIARLHRDRAWADKHRRFGEWQPDDADADHAPLADPARWWYLQGRAEAFAAIMSEIESGR